MPIAALIDEKIFCMHGGLSPDLQSMEQLKRIQRPTDIPDQGLLCDLLWSDPDADAPGWGESDRGVSFVFGDQVVTQFLERHDLDLICRAHQVVEDGYEFFAARQVCSRFRCCFLFWTLYPLILVNILKQLVTLFSAPNYCGEFDNAGAMMSVDDTLMCSFQILKPTEKKINARPGPAVSGLGCRRRLVVGSRFSFLTRVSAQEAATPPRGKKKAVM